MRDLVVLVAWLAVIPAAFTQPYAAVMLWVWTALIAPNVYVYSFLAGVQFNKIVVGITLISIAFSQESKKIKWNPTLIILTILLIQGSISYLLSGKNTAAPDIYNKFWKEYVLCLLLNLVITDRLRLHSFVMISCIALGFHGVLEGLKTIASGGSHHVQGIATLGDNNQFALAILMILPLMHYLSRQSVNVAVRWAWLAVLVLGCIAVVGTWSRGGFIGLVVLAVGFVFLSRRKFRSLVLVGVVSLVVAAVASAQYVEKVQTIENADSETSFMGRVLAWEVSFAIACDHPFFGAGYHATQDPKIWQSYVARVRIPEALKFTPLPPAKAAHSIYFEVMGDLGFLGFMLFGSLLYLGFRNVNKVIRYCKPKKELEWMYDLALRFRLTLIVYAVSGAAVSMAWFEFFYILLVLITASSRICHEIEIESIGGFPLRDDRMLGRSVSQPALNPLGGRNFLPERPR
jgi:probable O-glycosylation ligase (exosortase A-associated)